MHKALKNPTFPFDFSKTSLSVVIPAYNSERWIGETIQSICSAISKSGWSSSEVIVVDDGSSDGTAKIAKETVTHIPISVIKQKNLGRLLARKSGIDAAKGVFILLLDSRIITSPNTMKYAFEQITKNPKAVVWNGHILVDRQGNPFARFWYTVTFLAWRRYMRNPRLVHYGEEEYDYYPKGTTGFLAPKKLLLEAYLQFKTSYKDTKYSNDDTSLIKYIAAQTDIYISPDYSFTYISRSTLKAFIPHTLHRGIVFIDGHFRRGNRYFYACLAYLLLVPVFLIFAIFNPLILMTIFLVVLMVFFFAKILGADTPDAAALAYLMPVFALFYTAGLYKGLAMKLFNR